jgi:hypothetical protein
MAISGVGTIFAKKAAGSSVVYTPIAEVKNIEGPSASRAFLDSTTLDAVDGWRTYISGFKDLGTLTMTLNYTKAGYSALLADLGSDTASNYKITLPDSTTIIFDAFLTDLPLTIPEDIITVSATFKISGKPTTTFPS